MSLARQFGGLGGSDHGRLVDWKFQPDLPFA